MSTPSGPRLRRHNGKLPRNHTARFPKFFVVFDTEANRIVEGDHELQTLRLGVATFVALDDELGIVREESFTFRSATEFATYLEMKTRKDQTLWVFAHNLSYDLELTGLPFLLEERGWKCVSLIYSDPPTCLRFQKNRTSVLFIDTFNYFQASVAQLGKIVGVEKLDYESSAESDETLVTYCKRDVEIVKLAILHFMRFLKQNDLGGLQMTLASQAFTAFRHRFMKEDIYVHNDDNALKLERDGYYGGRVEAFFIGELQDANYYKLDVNSMYPHVMRSFDYPTRLVAYSENIPVERLFYLMQTYYVIADVEIETDKNCFPFRGKDKLIFPVGRFRTVLHHAELELAREHATIHHVYRVAIYEKKHIFDEYVDFFYTIKREAESKNDKVTRQMSKLFMNSLYGKFGQTGHHTLISENTTDQRWGRICGFSERLGKRVETVYFKDQMIVSWQEGESYYSCPAIAGAVTAYARVTLWKYMTIARLEHVFYCDTDSLIVNDDGYRNLLAWISKDELGYLKVEGISSVLVIFGAKDYRFGDDVKIKGVPKRAVKISEGVFVYDQFEKLRSWLNRGAHEGVIVKKVEKRRKGKYDKGVVLDTGFVIPHLLSPVAPLPTMSPVGP
jgi:hypothetical protein